MQPAMLHPAAVEPRSICVLRLSSLGDVTHVLPSLHALRDAWPGTALTWIIGRKEHELLRDLPGVEFIVFDKRGGWRAIRDLRARLRRRVFDVLLLMQLSLRANLLSTLVRARRRIGFDRGRARELHRWVVSEYAPAPAVRPQHVVDALRDLLRPLGIPLTPPRWELPVAPRARAWARGTLGGTAHTLVICPASSHPLRNWRPERYAEVADYVAHFFGFQIVLAGGPGAVERALAEAIRSHARTALLDLTGQAGLPELLALIEQASALLAPDTGPVHFASALGTPVIGLFAATDSRRSGPYGDRRFCVDRFGDATLSRRARTPEQLRWGARIEERGVMDLISSAEVIDAFQRLARERGWAPRAVPAGLAGRLG